MSLYKISDIEKLYPDWYDTSHSLSYDEQKFIWENTPLPKEDESRLKQTTANNGEQDVNLNGSVNGTYKHEVKSELNLSKREIVFKLKQLNYKTPPREIATYLEILFIGCGTKEGHWLYVSQIYPVRAINRVIALMIKQHKRGEKTINNPARYFTYLIKHRKKRRSSRVSMVAVDGLNK